MAELLETLPDQGDRFVEALYEGFERDRTIFLIGNGGSAANASHFAQDLAKGTLPSMSATRRFRVVALTDNIGFITALANDEGYDAIFEQQLRNLAGSGDILDRDQRVGELAQCDSRSGVRQVDRDDGDRRHGLRRWEA